MIDEMRYLEARVNGKTEKKRFRGMKSYIRYIIILLVLFWSSSAFPLPSSSLVRHPNKHRFVTRKGMGSERRMPSGKTDINIPSSENGQEKGSRSIVGRIEQGGNNNSFKYRKNRIKVPDFITSLGVSYDSEKALSTSRQILYICEQIEDTPTLEATIQYLLSTSIRKVNQQEIPKCLISLLTPRDQTNIVRLLGSRKLFYTMLCLVKNLVDSNTSTDDSNNDIQYLYAAAMTALAKSSNPKYRMRCISLLDEMDGLKIVPNSYVITAAFLSVDGGEDARALLKRSRAYKGMKIDVHIYNAAIYSCSRNPISNCVLQDGHDWQSALSFFRQMRSKKIQPNQQTYASLLQACAKSGQVKVALALFDEMRKTRGVDKPGGKVWGIVLNSCSVAGDWERAIKLLLNMQNEEVRINNIHINSLLSSLAKVGMDDVAYQILNDMQSGQPVTILRNYLPNNNNDDSYGEMKLPFPDIISVNTVLTAFAERNKKIEAEQLLARMKEGDFSSKHFNKYVVVKPDIISYNTVLSTFQDPEDAVSLLHEIRMTRKTRYNIIKPTCQTYTNAISICMRSNPPNLPIALSLLNDSSLKDDLKPNKYIYSAAIWTAERCGDAKTALCLLQKMHTDRCKPNVICYNGVISAMAKNGMINDIILLFKDMKEKHIPASPTTFRLIAIGASNSNLDLQYIHKELEKLLKSLNKQERHVQQSGPIYNQLIRGYGSTQEFESAMRVFKMMDQTDEVCLSSILFVCSTLSPARWKEAVLILHSSDIVAGCQGPGNVHMKALSYAIIACSKEDQWQEAINLLELYGTTMNSQSPAVTVDAINSVIAAAGRLGRPDVSLKALNEMSYKYSQKPNERTYRSAIIACNQAEHEKRRQRAKNSQNGAEKLKLRGTIGESGVDPLSFEWWEASLSLLRRMKEDSIQPSIQTYSSVISACEAAGEWQRAVGILSSMTKTNDVACQPNLYCLNACLAALEKGGAWLEAVELYERMKTEGGPIKPNFISISSVLIALDKAGQRELAENIYQEALKDKIFSPWRFTLDSKCTTRIRVMDLHQHSVPMAKIAVRIAIDSLLGKPSFHAMDINEDLIVVLGKGKHSEGKAKLMPIIKDLLENEYEIKSSIEEENSGRLRILSEVLVEFSERRRWQ